MAENRSYELSREMIDLLAAECDPRRAVDTFTAGLSGLGGAYSEQAAAGVFEEYGRRWAGRTVELGEKYSERTYEVLKEAAEKTGRLAFPHILQRFVEIGYLATQPMEQLKIMANNHYHLAFRVEQCCTPAAIAASCGPGAARELPCRHACTSFLQELCRLLQMDAGLEVESLRGEADYCQFRLTNRKT